jgi:hypothetical protein
MPHLVSDAHAEHTRKELMHMLSMRISTKKIKNCKKSFLTLTNGLNSSPEWPQLRKKTSLKIH